MSCSSQKGYTLIELLIIITIIGILASIASPHYFMLTQKAFQAKAKANLGHVRSAINVYYADNEGHWPLSNYPIGNIHYTVHGKSLTGAIAPYMETVPTPVLRDPNPTYNGLSVHYDGAAESSMNMSPPNDVFIIQGEAAYTPLLNSPFAYDNQRGWLYICNGNYDTSGMYFFDW